MTRTRLTIVFAFLLLPLLLLGAVAYLLSDTGLNSVVRPHLERHLGERLGAEVRLERIALGWDRLEVSGVAVVLPSQRLFAERLEADFRLSDLLALRLASVRVIAPELEIADAPGEGGAFPERPPLFIERVQIVAGRLTLHAAGRPWIIEEIDLQGRLDEETPFYVTARLGDDPGLALSSHGRLLWGEIPSVRLDSARLDGEELLASPLTVHFPEEGAAAGGAIGIERFDEAHLARIAAVLGVDTPIPPEVRFALEGLRLSFDWGEERLRLALTARRLAAETDEVDLVAQELRLRGEGGDDLWEVEGDLLLAAGAPLRFEATLSQGEARGDFTLSAADPAALLSALAGGEWPAVSGGIEARGTVRAGADALRVEAALTGTPAAKANADLPDLSGLFAEFAVERRGEEVSAAATLVRHGKKIARAEGDLNEIEVVLYPLASDDLAPLLPSTLRAHLAPGIERLAGRAVLRPQQEGWSARLALSAARVPLTPAYLEEVRLEGMVAQRAERASFEGVTLEARLGGEGLPSARLSAVASGELRGERYRIVVDRFAAEGVEFIAADGMSGLSGASVRGRAEIAGAGEGPVRLDLHGEINGGEVLHGAFYADLSSLPVQLRLQGDVDPASRRLDAQRLSVAIAEVVEASLHGSIDEASVDLSATAELADLARSAARLQVLAESFPLVKDVAPSGALSAGGRFRLDETGWRLHGSAAPRHLGVQAAAMGIDIEGLSGSLPFDLGSAPASGEARAGAVSVARLAFRGAELRADTIALHSAPGRFALPDPLVFAMAGGEIEIDEAQAHLTQSAPAFSAVLRVRGIDLGELTRELGTIEMAGRLSADLGRIVYGAGTLTTEGEMKIDAFGGHFRVRNVRLESLFTPYMTSSLDVDFTGVNLRLLTATFDFGEVNGIADGYIHELRLFGAVPSHFEASFETRTRGQRNISVAAVRNITTISQGGLSGVLSRGVYRFIDFYRYRKIGLHCTLRNDVFVLTGTAREGDERYLVDGGLLPPKINIIAPEHAISFKEMLGRLQRLDRAGGN